MERGGVYLMVSFLAGTMVTALLQSFIGFHIPQPVLLVIISISIFRFITFATPKRLNISSKKRQIIAFAVMIFFFLGICNMQRYNHNGIQNTLQTRMLPQNYREAEEKGWIEKWRQDLKTKFAQLLEKHIPNNPDRAVILALTIGDKSHIPYSLKEAYRASGATHLLALSGMHAAIIYGIINITLFFLNFNHKSRQFRFFIATIIIFLFTYITGFSASVQRAAIMITIWKGITLYNRKASRWSAWLISACIILLINPSEIYNIGFQLSFAAVAGIIALYPVINGSFAIFEENRYLKRLKPVWEMAGISVVCQIATAPLAWYYFNSAPTYFLITNLIAIPLTTIVIYALAMAITVSPIPIAGEIVTIILQKSIRVLNFLVEYIGRIS